MKVAVLAAEVDPALVQNLRDSGIDATAVGLPAAGASGAASELAAAFRAAEQGLASGEPAAALVTGEGDAALAALVTAVKLRIPAAWLRPRPEAGGRLAALADVALGATTDAAGLAASIRELATPNIG